jgi:hypothetical protein
MALIAIAATLLSGLHGIVTRGPTTPVCRVGIPCSAPAAGAVLVFSREGHVVARITVGARGRYTVRLAPGLYAVTVSPTPKIGSGIQPRTVRVPRGLDVRQDFSIDTGIR